ncbi:MAG: carbohydrate ABC transporter permease [Deltaproteobacteria bacterium]|jgi:sn-glycerol 3-phosphate transport system permease protein|nr:carbohydrate ABC transporter permease [Deltaproteobacteria bacterium]MBW2529975.1 carbohydrate ABC transporter permease [Deltaproteobacteria bacterium]
MTGESRGGRIASSVVLILVALVWLGPYLWMASTSLKTLPEIVAAPTYPLPSGINLEAYREVFDAVPVGRYLLNTVFMATAIAVLQILLALPAGYALAKLRFAGRRAAFVLVLGCLIIPAQVTFVPVFTMLGPVGLVNTMWALVLPFGVSAFGTFLVRQAMLSIPDEIIEAARMDGASEAYIVYRVLGPMVRPTLAALFLFSFVFHYSDYFWPLMMTTDDSVRTLPLAIALLREQGTGVRWHIVMAGNVILSAPILALFAVAQQRILRAVTARAL